MPGKSKRSIVGANQLAIGNRSPANKTFQFAMKEPLMSDRENRSPEVVCSERTESVEVTKGSNRRAFLGRAGAAAAMLAGVAALSSPAAAKEEQAGAAGSTGFNPGNPTQNRAVRGMQLRVSEATRDLTVRAVNVNNGDDALYPDRVGTFTKGLAHDAYGRVAPASYASLKKALASSNGAKA